MEKQLNSISERVRFLQDDIIETAIKYNRNPKDITLMAVTKTRTYQEVNEAIQAGITLLGENKAQELLARCDNYDKRAQVHFIGQLQTNKVKQIVDKVTLIHSVDSVKLLNEINSVSQKLKKVTDILIEVNIGNEPTKGGILKEDTFSFAENVCEFKNIRLRGLMAIPPSGETYEIERYFYNMLQLYVDISEKKLDNSIVNILSLGMSEDYKIAIKYGSNILRLGTAIFGERNYNK